MKRKIFSKLLMGALLVASVSSFVSCKDYDDDINNLQDQINAAALKSDLSALQTTLASVQTTASSAASTAQSALEKAGVNATDIAAIKATATAQGDKIADAATQAAKGVTDAAAAQAAANAAQSTADAAKADAATAKAAAEAAQAAATAAKADADAAIAKAIADLKLGEKLAAKADAADLAALTTKVNGLATDLAKAQTDLAAAKALADANAAAITALETKATDFETRIAALEAKGSSQGTVEAMDWATAITSIEFAYAAGFANSTDLNFQYGKELDNVFGDKKEANAYAATDKPKTYVAGDSIEIENLYIVRVSPVDADLTKSTIKLLNTKGESLDNYVNISVEKYDELVTRGDATGLWRIAVSLKDGFKIEDLQKATSSKFDTDGNLLTAAVYAFQVNNTDEAATRYATTAYDLKPLTGKYIPATTFNFLVDGVVNNYYNRWDGAKIEAEDATIERGEDFFELKWQANAAKDVYVPATKIIYDGGNDGKTDNVAADAADARKGNDFKNIEVGGSFTISFAQNQWSKIDRYYVLLDAHNAIESAPSELQSWLKYDIKGLGEMKRSMETLTITVDDEEAEGDIIGFRVYAVNYDGTLADPDGKAFYVQVGEAAKANAQTATAQYTAFVSNSLVAAAAPANADIIQAAGETDYNWGVITAAQAGIDPSKFQKLALAAADAAAAVTVKVTDGALDVAQPARYALLKAYNATTGEFTLAGNWQEINYVAFGLQKGAYQVDNSVAETTLALEGRDGDHHNKLVNTLKMNVKKNLPTAPLKGDVFSWKDGSGVSGNNLTLYMLPVPAAVKTEASVDWTQNATWGVKDLAQLCNMGTATYRFIFANARPSDATGLAYERLVNPTTTATKSTKIVVDAAATAVGPNTTAGTYVLALEGPATQADATKRKIGASSALTVQYEYAEVSRSVTVGGTAAAPTYTYSPTTTAITTAATEGVGNDKWVDVDSKTVTFSYPIAENTYSWAPYYYASAWSRVGAGTTFNPTFATSSAYEIQFYQVGNHAAIPANSFVVNATKNAVIPGGGTSAVAYFAGNEAQYDAYVAGTVLSSTLTNTGIAANALTDQFSSTTVDSKILAAVRVSNSKFAQFNGSLDALLATTFVANGYDEIGQAGITAAWPTPVQVRFVSKNTGVQEYYQTVGNATAVYFAGVSATDIPLSDVQSQLVVKAKDAFGFEKTIFAGDVLLKK